MTEIQEKSILVRVSARFEYRGFEFSGVDWNSPKEGTVGRGCLPRRCFQGLGLVGSGHVFTLYSLAKQCQFFYRRVFLVFVAEGYFQGERTDCEDSLVRTFPSRVLQKLNKKNYWRRLIVFFFGLLIIGININLSVSSQSLLLPQMGLRRKQVSSRNFEGRGA